MRICEPPLKSGPRKGQTATGTISGVSRHHKAFEPACRDCFQAIKRMRGGATKGITFKRDRNLREQGPRYPVKTYHDPSIIR